MAAVPASAPDDRRKMDLVWSYTFSYLLGALLLVALIWSSGVWNFLANTRLLSVLIDSGVVSYHDAQTGFIRGVPDLKYYLKSQDPMKWGLVEGAALIFLVFWLIKAAQFHGFCQFVGVRGTFTQHARAYLEGVGVNRLLPFNQGMVRMTQLHGRPGRSRRAGRPGRVSGGALRRHRDRGLRRVRSVRPGLVGLAGADLLVPRDPGRLLRDRPGPTASTRNRPSCRCTGRTRSRRCARSRGGR